MIGIPKKMINRSATFIRAVSDVQRELRQLGLWDEYLAVVEVKQVTFSPSMALGYQWYGSTGDIIIPKCSFGKLQQYFGSLNGSAMTSIRDVLRHEYAHAYADTHRATMRTPAFKNAFQTPHKINAVWSWEYDPEIFVSEYAATNSGEDFAETFMIYVKHKGVLPYKYQYPAIEAKFDFVASLVQ